MTTTLYRRGRIHSPADPFATALLVDAPDHGPGVIAWVGGEPGADALSPDRTVDLEDGWLAPAFVDAHVHATATGLALTGLDLTSSVSLSAALDQVERACRSGRGAVVLGTGWDDTRWPEKRPPTAAELDRASYGGVVYLARTDVHSAVVSSALLAAAPQSRTAVGFLGDGLVRHDAHHLLRAAAYQAVTPHQRRAAQTATLTRAAALGVACVHECGGPDIGGEEDFSGLLALRGPLPLVIGYWGELVRLPADLDRVRALGAAGAGGDLFVDGTIGSHTAALSVPYDDAATSGQTYLTASEIARHVQLCTEAGLQAGFHAIGDAAVDAVLRGVGAAAEHVGTAAVRRLRHRVEHAEMLDAAAIGQLSSYGMVASVQPAFDARWGGDGGMYATRLGTDRARAMNPLAGLATAGVAMTLGSDAPVTPLDPWGAVRAAMDHQTRGSGLSARAAFTAHTRGGWRAAGIDGVGELVPGAPATFAVWEVPGELRVQTPDDRVAGWSTDPRAGVAGLPDLAGPDPVCRWTVRDATTIYDQRC